MRKKCRKKSFIIFKLEIKCFLLSGEWKHGFFTCCFHPKECLIGYCCPCCLAYMTSSSAEEGTLMSFLQCCFYPLLIPLLRCRAREKKQIDVRVLNSTLFL